MPLRHLIITPCPAGKAANKGKLSVYLAPRLRESGMLSDYLKPTYGDESVRYALLWVVVIGATWATLHYVLAARTLRRDLEAKFA